MNVERINDEILVRFSANMKISNLQDLLDYLRYEELTSQSSASQNDVDELIKAAKKDRWRKIKSEIELDEKDNC